MGLFRIRCQNDLVCLETKLVPMGGKASSITTDIRESLKVFTTFAGRTMPVKIELSLPGKLGLVCVTPREAHDRIGMDLILLMLTLPADGSAINEVSEGSGRS